MKIGKILLVINMKNSFPFLLAFLSSPLFTKSLKFFFLDCLFGFFFVGGLGGVGFLLFLLLVVFFLSRVCTYQLISSIESLSVKNWKFSEFHRYFFTIPNPEHSAFSTDPLPFVFYFLFCHVWQEIFARY